MSNGADSDGSSQPVSRHSRLFAFEGPVGLREALAMEDIQPGIRSSLERYSDEIISALSGPDSRGFVLALLGEWGSGKTSAMLTLLDLVNDRLEAELPRRLRMSCEPQSHEPLAREILVTSQNGSDHWHPVTCSVLRAPLSLRPGYDDARLALAYSILWGLPTEMKFKIANWLRKEAEKPQLDDARRRLEVEQFLRESLRQQVVTGTDLEQWINEARHDCLADRASIGSGAEDQGSAFLQKNVHLTMLDDLDRAPLDYTAQILNAMRFWVDTEGMFFVVAAREPYLVQAVQRTEITGADGQVPDGGSREALQKFVHHELHLPPMFRNPVDVVNYWKHLLVLRSGSDADSKPSRGLDMLKGALDAFTEAPARHTLGVLAPLLSPRVVDPERDQVTPLPREAKRAYNALLGEIAGLHERSDLKDLKSTVAAIAWRDAWRKYVQPALTEREPGAILPGPKEMALKTGLNLGRLVLPAKPEDLKPDDLKPAVFRLGELAKEARFSLDGLPASLLLYLATDDPPFDEPAGTGPIGIELPRLGRESSEGISRRATSPDLFPASPHSFERGQGTDDDSRRLLEGPVGAGATEFTFRDTRQEERASEIAQNLSVAARMGDVKNARILTDQLMQSLRELAALTDARDLAPGIGNAALRLEADDQQLAWTLHQLAHALDPLHPNVRLNLADFLLDYARDENAMAEVASQLDWVAANAPDLRPQRQLILRVRLERARGNEEAAEELIQSLLDQVRQPTASFDEVASALVLLRQLKDRREMTSLVRERLDLRLPDDLGINTYRLLRMLGDELIEEDGEIEGQGVDILRHLLAVALCPDDKSVAAVLNNLALIYNNRGGPEYEELAGMLWRHALEIDPSDQQIRRAYARFLEPRDPDSSNQLLQGRMPSIPIPADGAVRRLAATLPAHLSQGPHWWEDFTPPEPMRGFPELAFPDHGNIPPHSE